jgi:hypothetical protein
MRVKNEQLKTGATQSGEERRSLARRVFRPTALSILFSPIRYRHRFESPRASANLQSDPNKCREPAVRFCMELVA